MMKTPRNAGEVEQVKNRILDQALAIICREGLDALTMRRLAKQTGMTAPNLYNYYSSKDVIYIAIVIKGFGILADRLNAAAAGADSPARKARACMLAYIEFGFEYSAYYEIMFTRATPKYEDYVGTPYEELSAVEYRISMEIAALAADLVAKLSAGRQSDEIITRRVIEVWTLLHGIVSLSNSRMVGYVAKDTTRLYHTIVDEMLGLFQAH